MAQKGNSTSKQWFLHVFYCPPSVDALCQAVKRACEVSAKTLCNYSTIDSDLPAMRLGDYVSTGRLALMLGMYQKEGLGSERATVERRRRQAVGGTNEAGV